MAESLTSVRRVATESPNSAWARGWGNFFGQIGEIRISGIRRY